MTVGPLLLRVAALLEYLGIDHAFMGGQAVIQLGEPRFTRDVDALVEADYTRVSQVAAAAKDFGLRPPDGDVEVFVRQKGVLVLYDEKSPMHVDLVFGWTPYEQEALTRKVAIPFDEQRLEFITAEDLILHKMFASRPQDIEDVKGVLLRQRGKLDLGYIRHWLPQLAEVADEPGIVEKFEAMLVKYYYPPEGKLI